MEQTICIDTDILIDILRKKPEAIEWLLEQRGKIIYTTVINLFELYYGAEKSRRKENKEDCEELLQNTPILNLEPEAAKLAGIIAAKLESRGQNIGLKDILIGAIAKTNNIAVKTNNKKHFERIEGLKIL